jgi:HEAT repeat protein
MTPDEVGATLARALSGRGSPTDVRERTAATGWLLQHEAEAYPRVLEMAAAEPNAGLIELLGRFRRSESTRVLLDAFQRGGAVRRAAAVGLGVSPDARATEALRTAVESGAHDDRVAALGGLEASGDRRHCGSIVVCLEDEDAEVRWMAIHAAAGLGCIGHAELQMLAKADADPDVRALAASLALARPPE